MEKISIKRVIEFRAKSEKSKKNFAKALGLKQKKSSEGGGDYWVRSVSAISNSYRLNDIEPISSKIDELQTKLKETHSRKTKDMYQRNMDILLKYKEFDFKKWKPSRKLTFQKKQKGNSILTIKGLEVQISAQHVFTFVKDESQEVGAIWFIAKLNGFKRAELGMFADALNRYLNTHFSNNFILNSKYCIAVDVFNNIGVSYLQLEKSEIPFILDSTLEEIKKLI